MTERVSNTVAGFLLKNRVGILSTFSASRPGFPFGSLVPYDVRDEGDLTIYVSYIAEHFKNLSADPRASITVVESLDGATAQAAARASLLIEAEQVAEDELDHIKTRYTERFPKSLNAAIAGNFTFLRCRVEAVYWIGGFGKIQWIEKDDYRKAFGAGD